MLYLCINKNEVINHSQQQLFYIMQYSIEVRAAHYCIEIINHGTKATVAYITKSGINGKFNYFSCIDMTDIEILAKHDAHRFGNNGWFDTYQDAMDAALRVINYNVNMCVALEVWADAANIALHTDIANAAQADAAQCEVEQAISENNGIDFVQVYIDGMPHEYATAKLVAKYYPNEFLKADFEVNAPIELAGNTMYLQEVILDTCFDHQNGIWEFWANPAFPDEKTLLMIYLRTTPVKARKSPKYPHELDYADGGDGYTSENMVLDF
jgi:hypothetical protein